MNKYGTVTIESKFQKKRFELFTGGKSERNLHLYEQAGFERFREETDESGVTYVYLEKKANSGANVSVGMCMGIAFGAVIGMLTDNTGLWIPIGLYLGLAVGDLLSVVMDSVLNVRHRKQTSAFWKRQNRPRHTANNQIDSI